MIFLLRKQAKHAYRHVLSFGTQPPFIRNSYDDAHDLGGRLSTAASEPSKLLLSALLLCPVSLLRLPFLGGTSIWPNFWGWFYKITDSTEKWCLQAASNGKRPEVNFSKNRIQLVTGASVNPMLHCQAIKALLEEQVRMVMEGQVTEVAETHHRISSGILKCLWKMLPQARWKADRVEFPDRVELCKGPHPLYVFNHFQNYM